MLKNTKHDLTIYIVTRDRHLQALDAIKSVLSQNCDNYRLIVSDNSRENYLQNCIEKFSNKLKYIRRSGLLSALEHFNACISEVDTKFFALFHDDDLMFSNFVESFWSAYSKFPNAIAYGSNAIIKKGERYLGEAFKAPLRYVGPVNAIDLGCRYFGRHQMGIAPLPSYVYRKTSMLEFDLNLGKYGDVQWLLMNAELGDLVWINKPLMTYQLHDGNDSNIESLGDRLKLLGFFKRHKDFSNSILLANYRRFLYKKILLKNNILEKSYRGKLLRNYLFYSQLTPRFIVNNYYDLFKKLIIKTQITLISIFKK